MVRLVMVSVGVCASLALGLPASLRADSKPAVDEGAVQAAPGIELLGFWHLTIHYRDDASANPGADRWDDRVWHFEKRGSRLQWTEYPIVIFEDATGRFEMAPGERRVRTLARWEPNPGQRAQIERGLLVNPRGARSKGLRGSPERGYRSAGGLRSESTGVIGYSESWTVEGLPDRPVFTQAVAMGSGRTEDLEGMTRYSADEVSPDGREVRGRYGRDETRTGRFVLRRAGAPSLLGGGRPGAR